MSHASNDRFGRPPQVWALLLFDALGTALSVAGAVHPATESTPTGLNAIAATVGVALIGGLWWAGRRAPQWLLHANVLLLIAFTTAMCAAAATGEGAASSAFTYVGVSLYVALFFRRPIVRAYAALVSACALGAFLANDAVTIPWTAWWPVAMMAVVAGEVLTSSLAQIRRLTLTDPLTGALNRAGFEEGAGRELAAATRTGRSMTVVVVDIDDFKAVNDRRGHAAGDDVLIRLVAQWRATLRPRDLLGRLGGDEFAVLLPETTVDEAEALVARLRDGAPVAWSYGAAHVSPSPGLEAALRVADERMYQDKSAQPAGSPASFGLAPAEPRERYRRENRRSTYQNSSITEAKSCTAAPT